MVKFELSHGKQTDMGTGRERASWTEWIEGRVQNSQRKRGSERTTDAEA